MNPLDSNRIGQLIQSYHEAESTNSLAAAQAFDPANHGLVVTATAQTAGRGQYGRVWQAPPGSSILMSVLLFPPSEMRRPSILTAWAADSVCDAIARATGISASIKWPNDVLIDGRKVCGILCEAGAQHIVAGIGLNLNQSTADFEKMTLPDATSLSICAGRLFEVAEMTSLLIACLDQRYSQLTRGDIAAVEAEWKQRFGLVGKLVIVESMDGLEQAGRLEEMAFDAIHMIIDGTHRRIEPETIRHLRHA
jgi:BirA family biotin operon repressor/biotin-[acetyl-CoA-carboxylase] ligase